MIDYQVKFQYVNLLFLINFDDVSTLCTNECSREDLDLHLESTQSEIEQLRDILHGCNSFDANTLLGVSTLKYCWLKLNSLQFIEKLQ